MKELSELRRAAREIFYHALAASDAGRAVRRAVRLDGPRLKILDDEFDLARPTRLYSVAAGKAARPMAAALDEVLGARLVRGVVSAPPQGAELSGRWEVYAGGHPLPNAASLDAARAAFELLREANREDTLVLFLVSGGGSAMIESPRAADVTLEDLRETNRALVACGASIAEVNAVRRALSAVKGGGLASRAPAAAQVTLIVSDVNAGRESDVASGPTYPAHGDERAVPRVVEKYGLAAQLPASVLRLIERPPTEAAAEVARAHALRRHHVLLDNARAVQSAVEAARARGFTAGAAPELVEQHVSEGTAALVARLAELHRHSGAGGRGVCLVSGGEFACPVRGEGVGGRNAETALRCALEFEKIDGGFEKIDGGAGGPAHAVALCAGTDGIDGNSPASGAIADTTTLTRARSRGLDPRRHLADSDAHTFFQALGDALLTGPTGTNVRDLRILLAV